MKLKPYEKYKDSGVEWIGDIPEDWGIYKLKYFVNDFVSGGTPDSDNEKYWDESDSGIPWVTIADMKQDIVYSTNKKVSKEGLLSKNLKVLKKGTLIYSIFASLGKSSLLGIDATTNQAILGLITNNKINDIFLKYYLIFLENKMEYFSNSNTQNNLNSNIIKNFSICIINDIEKQEQIANFLDKKTLAIDKAIEKNKKLIELLEEKRTSLINHVVTKGLDPNAKMKNTDIQGMPIIPYHWKLSKIKHELYFLDYKRIPLSAEVRGTMEKKFDYYGASGVIDKVEDYIFDGEYILLGEDGANLLSRSSPLAFIAKGKFWVNNHAHILDCINGNIHFFTHLLETIDYSPFIKGSAQPKLTADDLKNVSIIVPPINEQHIIGEFLKSNVKKMNLVIEKINYNINLLEEYKKSFVHHSVTGKLKIFES